MKRKKRKKREEAICAASQCTISAPSKCSLLAPARDRTSFSPALEERARRIAANRGAKLAGAIAKKRGRACKSRRALWFFNCFLSLSRQPPLSPAPSLLSLLFLCTQLTGPCRCSSSPPRRWRRWTACFRRWRERLRRCSQQQAEREEPLSPPPPLHRRRPLASASGWRRASTTWPGTPFPRF